MSDNNKSSSDKKVFDKEDEILNYRPSIDFVEPDQETGIDLTNERGSDVVYEEDKIGSLRERTQDLINGYVAAKQIAEATQQRIDSRVRAAGGMTAKLDPVKDAIAIAAVKRRFPDLKDPTQITYEMYKSSLNCLNKQSPIIPQISDADIKAAKKDPTRTSFGGIKNVHGENRAEISSPANSVQPVNLEAFQTAAVAALFLLLLPMIAQKDEERILRHLAEAPHKPF